jgi:hypothetical protein
MTYDIVAGTTTPLQFQLIEAGAVIDLTSITVTLLLNDRIGNTVFGAGTVTITDAPNGKIQFTPASNSIFTTALGPYYARWVLTTAGGLVGYVPTTIRDVWNIVGQ